MAPAASVSVVGTRMCCVRDSRVRGCHPYQQLQEHEALEFLWLEG